MTDTGPPPLVFVAVIEDDVTVRHGLDLFLAASNVMVAMGANAEDVIGEVAFTGRRPDVIVANYHLVNETALEVVPRVQTALSLATPVIIATGDTSPQVREAVEARGWHLLIKPFQPAELLMTIAQVVPKP